MLADTRDIRYILGEQNKHYGLNSLVSGVSFLFGNFNLTTLALLFL